MKTQKLLGNLEIAAFCEQVAMVISAGIPAYEGISILMADAVDKETEDLLRRIYEPLEIGSTFHDALAESKAFPQYVLDMVEIGELSGKLEDVLHSLNLYYEREESIKSSIKSAVTYPLIMIAIMVTVVLVLVAKVLPIFNQIYTELGSGLTGFPLVMMHFSNALNTYAPVVLTFIILLVIATFLYTRTNSFRLFIQRQRLAMNTASSRFANCMTMAISSGLDTSQGLDMAERLVDNPYMKARIQKCKELVEEGFSFADAILATKIFTKTYATLLNIGFRTGSLEKVMDKIFREYEDNIDYEINRFVSRLEPALVIVLSVIIGFILLSFLLPLIGIMASIG
ncbi:MAG: type II secretion system F family protein [Roseburia sp.]|nr:type II secretion system F family protein [Roseburia sp.]